MRARELLVQVVQAQEREAPDHAEARPPKRCPPLATFPAHHLLTIACHRTRMTKSHLTPAINRRAFNGTSVQVLRMKARLYAVGCLPLLDFALIMTMPNFSHERRDRKNVFGICFFRQTPILNYLFMKGKLGFEQPDDTLPIKFRLVSTL